MKRFVIFILVVVLALAGAAGVVSRIVEDNIKGLNCPILSAKPDDIPMLVIEPPEAAAELPPPLAELPDLTKVDRRVIEPANLVKPRYCLLVFGLRGETRVWLIEDGETMYVDRNANGDLTEAGKAFAPTMRRDNGTLDENGKEIPYRERMHVVETAWTVGRTENHKGRLKLLRTQRGDKPAEYIVTAWLNGDTLQHAGGPIFSESRQTAPVIHFGGPVVPWPLRGGVLHLRRDGQELNFCIGTPGLGSHSFATVGLETVPANVRPELEIAWPTATGTLRERFALARRC